MIRIPVLAFSLAVMATVPAAAQQYPAEPGDGVADVAGLLSAAQEDSIASVLHALRTDPGVEVRVLTVQSIAEFRTGHSTPEAFATGVYNEWKLGYGQKQDGVLVMVSVEDRFARIELGDNVPAHQEPRMQRIMDEVMVPRFRDGDYDAGVVEGVRAVATAFRDSTAFGAEPVASYTPPPSYTPPARYTPRPAYNTPSGGSGGDNGTKWILLGVAGLGAAGISGASWLRYRKRNCPQCRRQMRRLDEKADDVYLDSGRKMEEVMGTVDYDVWRCDACNQHQVLRYGSVFTGRRRCRQCSYVTVDVRMTTLQSPTYHSTGTQRLTMDCRHCGWHDEDIVTLPRLERNDDDSSYSSSGSSSSGGSSWDGGSSGGHSSGGGASGRW